MEAEKAGAKHTGFFQRLLADKSIAQADILKTADGFFMVNKSVSDILREKNILYFLDSAGERLTCDRFFDDWFLYAAAKDGAYRLIGNMLK